MSDLKQYLRNGLQGHRDALLWKVQGLSERQARWPMTPTGTNLLGLVKHTASVEAGYFGEVFGRPFPEPIPWFDDGAEDNADFFATEDESVEGMCDFYRRIWAHSDDTIEALELDAPGIVPWWGPAREHVTLGQIMLHMTIETARHAGHADILRELADGRVGLRDGNVFVLHEGESDWWRDYNARLRAIAESFPALAGR